MNPLKRPKPTKVSSEHDYENSTLSTNVSKLYLDTESADVYFVFNEKKKIERIPAHKNLLAIGSDAFKAMFYGDMKEKGDVTIVDSTADAFKEFLQIFYLSRVKFSMENIFDVVNLCKKYVVASGLNICEQFLKDTLTDNNVCLAYNIAILFNLHEIKELCEEKFTLNTTAVLDSESFLESPKSVVAHILKLNILMCTEVELFEACMAWVKAASKEKPLTREIMREHLGDLFYEIRFGSMKFEEFTALIPLYGSIFPLDETHEILQMIGTKEYKPKMFNGKRRLPLWNKNAIIKCCLIGPIWSSTPIYPRNVESIKFSANKLLLLGEITCVQNSHNASPTEMNIIEYSDADTFEVVFTQNAALDTAGKSSVLQKPVLIKPRLVYEIQLKQKQNGENFCFYSALPKVGVQMVQSGITIQIHDNLKPNRGIITDLRFNQILKS